MNDTLRALGDTLSAGDAIETLHQAVRETAGPASSHLLGRPFWDTQFFAALAGAIVGGILTLLGTMAIEVIKQRREDKRRLVTVLRRLQRNIHAVNDALEELLPSPNAKTSGFYEGKLGNVMELLTEYREYQDDMEVLRDRRLVGHIDAFVDRTYAITRGAIPIHLGSGALFLSYTLKPLPHQVRVSILTRCLLVGRRLVEIVGRERARHP